MPVPVPQSAWKPYFGSASCAAPFAGALFSLVPGGTVEQPLRAVFGIVIASGVGMVCVAVAIGRRERPWWIWLAGLLLNAYPFIFFVLGLAVQLGITRIHM